jgi:hypothetical protein
MNKLRAMVLSFPDFTDISGITLCLGVKRKAYHMSMRLLEWEP